ncbi:MAG: tRNA 2-thiouridine(34) synthase MnmA [Gammaproteobacteria bacterium]
MSSTNSHRKVVVGLSGGVDSSVAALLLKRAGYQVEGLFMKNWDEDDSQDYCHAAEDLADVDAVCRRIGIPYHTVNFSHEYWENVFEHFLAEYRAGRTPNPDILCNREIKFKTFLDYARGLGADAIATGHYARRERRGSLYSLLRGRDAGKDQSYFLYAVAQDALAHSLFPVGELEKSTVRQIATEAGLVTHAKRDSTGICFIGERRFKAFLQRYLPARPGRIETLDGQEIGRHEGLMYYTLGQRQGLGIGGRRNAPGKPWYVAGKDLERNVLLVVQGGEHPALFSSGLHVGKLAWVASPPQSDTLRCTAKVRYRQSDQACTLRLEDRHAGRVTFDTPQRAVTPGQSVVFYRGEECLGGGVIEALIGEASHYQRPLSELSQASEPLTAASGEAV